MFLQCCQSKNLEGCSTSKQADVFVHSECTIITNKCKQYSDTVAKIIMRITAEISTRWTASFPMDVHSIPGETIKSVPRKSILNFP